MLLERRITYEGSCGSPLSLCGGKKMGNIKSFKSYDQQVDFLIDEKGLIISNRLKAIELLKKHSYFDLINGYKYPFKSKDGKYKKNTSIEDIYYLYCFDDKIRYSLMKCLMEVEIHIKSLLSYSFCEIFGENQQKYLDATNYNYIGNHNLQNGINKLIQILNETLNDYKSFKYIKHQKITYNNVPLWVISKAMTFGNISKMYSFQKPEIQSKISKEFIGISEGDLVSFLDLLSRFRNVCAHNERLFDYKYLKRNISDTEIHKILKIDKKNNEFTKGKSDLFAVIISLKYLLSDESFDNLVTEIENSIEDLFLKTKQIQRLQLYKYMGFPENWKDIKNISLEGIKNKTLIN